MLFFEDYLEMIENLPIEMRDRFTEMREMDLAVQNALDGLEERIKSFFKKCKTVPNVKQEWKDEQFGKIKEDYNKALEETDEKVQLASQMHDLVDRHIRKLDQELTKFKLELEADNAGITEVLEKKSLELDIAPLSHGHRGTEKRKYSHSYGLGHLGMERKRHSAPQLIPAVNDHHNDSYSSRNIYQSSPAPSPGSVYNGSSSSLNYSLGHVGASSNAALQVAASRAIGATLEMQQGRRTSSLRASYEVMNRGNSDFTKDFHYGTGRDYGYRRGEGQKRKKYVRKRHKEQQQRVGHSSTASLTSLSRTQSPMDTGSQRVAETPPPTLPDLSTELGADLSADAGTATEWQGQYDPKEPRYCVCNEVSYGEMVGCDNEDCPIEWFHYPCVGLVHAPKGKWYCPQCKIAMKRRGAAATRW